MTWPTSLRFPLVALALALTLLGCGDDEPSGSDTPSSPESSAPESSTSPTDEETTEAPPSTVAKELDFATVESLTASRFQSDPNCAYGVWSPNSTGIDEKFARSAKTIQQFDCYLRPGDANGFGFPERGQQSIFVEFKDPARAEAFAEEVSILYKALVAGAIVVVAGTGLDTVDMDAYLADLQSACGCGELFNNA